MEHESARGGRERVSGAAGVLLVALLGFVGPAVSETTRALCPPTATVGPAPSAAVSLERVPMAIATHDASSAAGRLASDGMQSPDEASLVPGIFAWDPDVRFVYFRHVGKWM